MSTISIKEIERNLRKMTLSGREKSLMPRPGRGVCAKRDGERETSNNHHHLRKDHRRQRCATIRNIFATAQPTVARSVTQSLA